MSPFKATVGVPTSKSEPYIVGDSVMEGETKPLATGIRVHFRRNWWPTSPEYASSVGSTLPSLRSRGDGRGPGWSSDLHIRNPPALAFDLHPYLGHPSSWRGGIDGARLSLQRRRIRDDRNRPVEAYARIDNVIQSGIAAASLVAPVFPELTTGFLQLDLVRVGSPSSGTPKKRCIVSTLRCETGSLGPPWAACGS